ncbi:MAG: energy transducer TonB [Campylobacter sp.]|nr:energy transducer TonB [Campylobacter sp.]
MNRNSFIAITLSGAFHLIIIYALIFNDLLNTSIAESKNDGAVFALEFYQVVDGDFNSDMSEDILQSAEISSVEAVEAIETLEEEIIFENIESIHTKAKKSHPKPPNSTQKVSHTQAGGKSVSGDKISQNTGSNLLGEIYAALKKHTTYPKKALEREYEGRVLVSFRQINGSEFEYIKIIKPCKWDILNSHALSIVKHSAKSMPKNAYNKDITVPITFSLKEIR